MSDRVSHKPPTTYIGEEEEEVVQSYEHEKGEMRGRKLARSMQHSKPSAVGSSADRSEGSRHSGIFRFGKSLAASFIPSNWKLFSKAQDEVEESQEQLILRQRREKAERMYQELKNTGHFRDSNFGPSLFQHQEETEPVPMKHDSGVEFGDRRSRSISRMSRMSAEMSKEEKRMGRIFLEPPQPPPGSDSKFSQSTASSPQKSVCKGKFQLKRPSLSNIRKATTEDGSDPGKIRQARRIPSRKDLQKQQKLVKRVSDLEGKLEAARRQLTDAMDAPVPSGPPPRRQPFVPGAMPSLPSERLLTGFGDSENGMSESVSASQIGKALTRDASIVIMHSEQPDLIEPLRNAPSPSNHDDSISFVPDATAYDGVMQSVETEARDYMDVKEISANSERLVGQYVKPSQVEITHRRSSSVSHPADDSSRFLDQENSDYEFSEPKINHDSSPERSDVSRTSAPLQTSKPQTSEQQTSKSLKRKSTEAADLTGEKPFKPVPESESGISSLKPKRRPKKATIGAPPHKLRKTTTFKPSPPSHHNGSVSRSRQIKPGKKQTSVYSQSSNINFKGRQSVSPPPSGSFTGLQYKKPSAQLIRNGTEIGEARMATYSAVPSIDGSDVPPIPKLPKAVRLASGEVVNIPPQKINHRIPSEGMRFQQTGSDPSKSTKARSTSSPLEGGELRKSTSPKKNSGREHFEWPEDVF